MIMMFSFVAIATTITTKTSYRNNRRRHRRRHRNRDAPNISRFLVLLPMLVLTTTTTVEFGVVFVDGFPTIISNRHHNIIHSSKEIITIDTHCLLSGKTAGCRSSNTGVQLQLQRIKTNNYSQRNRAFRLAKTLLRSKPIAEEEEEYDDSELLSGDNSLATAMFSSSSSTSSLLPCILFGLEALWLVLITPDITKTKRLATKWGGAYGFLLASFLFAPSTIQQIKDLQHPSSGKSNSYKYVQRLYSGLFLFCVLGLPSGFPGEGGYWPTAMGGITTALSMTLVRLVGANYSWNGYWKSQSQQGEFSSSSEQSTIHDNDTNSRKKQRQLKSVLGSLKTFFNDILKLKKTDKKKAGFYRASAVCLFMIAFSNFMQGRFQLRYRNDLLMSSVSAGGGGSIPLGWAASLQFSSCARLVLIANTILALKQASENNLLSKPIFIQFNFMIALWAIIVVIGKGIQYPTGFIVDGNMIQLFAFGFLFALKGYKGIVEATNLLPATTTTKTVTLIPPVEESNEIIPTLNENIDEVVTAENDDDDKEEEDNSDGKTSVT